jgi:hypothetical protein
VRDTAHQALVLQTAVKLVGPRGRQRRFQRANMVGPALEVGEGQLRLVLDGLFSCAGGDDKDSESGHELNL